MATTVEQQHSYKLISFHMYDNKVQEEDEESDSPKNKYKKK
jgi:hypothetical protein